MAHVYVLQLEHGKYYVGFTRNIKQRLHKHLNTPSGGCSKSGGGWTRRHKAIGVDLVIEGDIALEDQMTISYMAKYGVDNVRGGKWTQEDLTGASLPEIPEFFHSPQLPA